MLLTTLVGALSLFVGSIAGPSDALATVMMPGGELVFHIFGALAGV